MRLEGVLSYLRWVRENASAAPRGFKTESLMPAASNFSVVLRYMITILGIASLTCSAPVPAAAAAVTIRNMSSGLCIDTGGSAGFTLLAQARCSGAASQNFNFQASPAAGYSYVVSAASSLCWDVSGGSGSAGAGIQQYSCVAVKPEYFGLSSAGAGVYRILSANMSNGCIDVVTGRIVQNTCNGSASQLFQVTNAGTVSVTISPTTATVASRATQQFTATVTGSNNTGVTWSASAGTVSTSGLFTAPAVTSSTAVTVKATSKVDTTKSASAAVTVSAPTGVAISITPTSVTVSSGAALQFTATVSGSTYTAVTWSSTNGSISTSGLYTAPAVTSTTTASVTATSQADTSKHASASVTVNPLTSGINVKNYGATGNGTTDDTAALKAAIAALTPGATLLLPCGTYRTSSTLVLNLSSITVDGSSCATIHDTGAGTVMAIGGNGNGNPNYGAAVALSATANELATSFTTVSSLGVSAGDYVYLTQGGRDSSTGSGDTGCDPSGCRGEVVKVASVSGNTITVTTALHDTYNPALNAAMARKMLTPLRGLTIKNLTLDGNRTNVYGLALAGIAESTISGVTAKNVQGAALLNRGHFNVSWSNITVTGAGSAQCGNAVWLEAQGNLSINGMSISGENPGTGSGCLSNGAFGFGLIAAANGTITNLTVDASGAYGRPFKTTAARYNTFNSPTVKNGVQAYNGVSLEYYSSHNTYNSCVVTNNGAGTGTGTGNAGINTFGNFNQYNSFNNCTVSGNGNVQVLVSNWDALRLGQDIGNTFNGGTYTGATTAEAVFNINGAHAYITSTRLNGPGAQGIYLGSTNACINNNIFNTGTSLSTAISSSSSTNTGSGNVLNGMSSNLTAGTCTGP